MINWEKFRFSDVPNADLYHCCVVTVQWRCERWFRESVETGRDYSWYLSAFSTQLHFHDKPWGTTARWGLILLVLTYVVCLYRTEMCWEKVGVKVLFMVRFHLCACKMCIERNRASTVTFLSFRIDRKYLWNSTLNTKFYSLLYYFRWLEGNKS